ncbi:RIC1-domain-containing protein [Pisolithus marmoratus]|nr:RIC1-domain-containing protein [Pisolithus marmoratus]
MYFPTSAARQLCTIPALPDAKAEALLCIEPNPRKSLFCALTRSELTVWRVRPSAPLAHLERSETSLNKHGENVAATWSPDGSRIVIQTTRPYLVLVTIEYVPENFAYHAPEIVQGTQRKFLSGPGEAQALQSLSLAFEGVIRTDGNVASVLACKHYMLFSTASPPAVQRIPWPAYDDSDSGGRPVKGTFVGYNTWALNDEELPWLVDPDVTVTEIQRPVGGVETWITSDGRVYFVRLQENKNSDSASDEEDVVGFGETSSLQEGHPGSSRDHQHYWQGTCVHHYEVPRWVQKSRQVERGSSDRSAYVDPRRATKVAVNARFSLIAVGTLSGNVEFTAFPVPGSTPQPEVVEVPNLFNRPHGEVLAMEWSSDGYVLAVGWQHGWAILSIGGRCLASNFGTDGSLDKGRLQDVFMHGVRDLFWGPENFELVALPNSRPNKTDGQIFILPFAKSATTSQLSPDNTRYAFLQLEDRVLVYRGADQPDMSVINPESDVWQHIKLPQPYLASNWPIRYSALSNDGRLVAVAGRRGLIHYSATSGRWKAFTNFNQEQSFVVKGGLLWFHHVLIVAVEKAKSYQIRLYSRDLELSDQNVLYCEAIMSPVVILSLVDNSLLVYTADNMLSHYLIIPTSDAIQLHYCGSITFNGVIAAPSAVRVLSWMIPSAQKQFGDPADDLAVATVLLMVGGQLVLLRPRKAGNQEVKYDMQIFADRIEFCWIHLRGIGALENSLWGYDGRSMRVWLNALTMESPSSAPHRIKESVSILLDFYPLSVLMDKGIIIGAESDLIARHNLPFVIFRQATSSHLFLHHILRIHLESGQVREAVQLAAQYQNLVFFAHALEILLHIIVESEEPEAYSSNAPLPAVIEFLDHFDVALDVVVGCARKTEVTRWRRLFNIVGSPQKLFEMCLATGRLKTAGSYLLILHNLEQLDENNEDVIRLLRNALDAQDWQLCRELLRFLRSVDESGVTLRHALVETGLPVEEVRP